MTLLIVDRCGIVALIWRLLLEMQSTEMEVEEDESEVDEGSCAAVGLPTGRTCDRRDSDAGTNLALQRARLSLALPWHRLVFLETTSLPSILPSRNIFDDGTGWSLHLLLTTRTKFEQLSSCGRAQSGPLPQDHASHLLLLAMPH